MIEVLELLSTSVPKKPVIDTVHTVPDGRPDSLNERFASSP